MLVDGVERSMDLVDVEDIASFSILKDATATALYGDAWSQWYCTYHDKTWNRIST
ncbi:Plug domain-containing protein [Bacteroides thetaiotaomicron]|uniref:Plug domain-containing protein n=1 Tax=Bacteroides thetaiotaomicron TaxID=818 RepID=UPI002165A7EC|nr:Plug domain-containing protein [Bacteroides thetaiotaomicron]MCS3332241.1 Plug domain-containing protein [Bacteroides thetaiotaomicron]